MSWVITQDQLLRHELLGHTVRRHVGKNEAELRARLQAEGLPSASSFLDVQEALAAINHVLVMNEGTIGAWMQRNWRADLRLTQGMPAPLGIVVVSGRQGLEQGRSVRVVLKRHASFAPPWYIVTAYPLQ